jgi:hypothetical protein
MTPVSVIPAKAGIQGDAARQGWIPAFAGMTVALPAGMTVALPEGAREQ